MKSSKNRPPVFISANPSHVDLKYLSRLYSTCNHSCHRLPNFDADGRVEAVNVDKLGVAIAHNSMVVSVFCRIDEEGLTQKIWPVTPSNGQLVGFGRAVSDIGLTASIYDVMVIPVLRRKGIGRLILQRIIRLFFEACGFGDDNLGSTTMMYLG